MKINELKGNLADRANNIVLNKYLDFLLAFNNTLDHEKYGNIEEDFYDLPGYRKNGKLFRYNKELKEFLTTGEFKNWRYWNYSSCTATRKLSTQKNLDEYRQKYGIKKRSLTENFTFENSIFSGIFELSISVYSKSLGDYRTGVSFTLDTQIRTKDPDALWKEIESSFGNTLGYGKLKDARGVEIKVGDIVAYSSVNKAKVRLGKVKNLGDVQVTLEGGEGSKYPENIIVVSREAITKI